MKFCICTWFAPNFPQVQYGGEELTEKGSKFAISKWTNTGFPNEQIHFSKPTNKSVETFPNEFPSPRQHLLHPGTMGKSHTQHPNIRQLPIAPQVQKTLIFTETSKWNVPQFSFLQGQLYIHVMKLNNSLKNSRWGLLGLIFSGAMYVVSFCKKFGILQPCPQCPGQYLASWYSLSLWVWSGPGTATTISHLWNFGTRPIYHLGSRKIVRIEGDTLFYSPFVLRHCFQHPFSYSS